MAENPVTGVCTVNQYANKNRHGYYGDDPKDIEHAIHSGVMQGLGTTVDMGVGNLNATKDVGLQNLNATQQGVQDNLLATAKAATDSTAATERHGLANREATHNAEARLGGELCEGFKDVLEKSADDRVEQQAGFSDIRRETTEDHWRLSKQIGMEGCEIRSDVKIAQKEILLEGCKSDKDLLQVLLEQFGKDRVESALYFGKIEKDAIQNKYELAKQIAECCCKGELAISELSCEVREGFAEVKGFIAAQEAERLKTENSDLKLKIALACR